MRKRNPKNVLIDYEQKMSLDEAITFLETIVNKLKTDKSLTLTLGEQSHQVNPADQVELEVKLEERNKKYSLELELEWTEGEGQQAQSLKIE